MFLGDLAKLGKRRHSSVCKHDIEFALLALDLSKEPIQIRELRDISLDTGNISSRSPSLRRPVPGSRRPVMKTKAPSLTNSFAVAKPMPLLPPVISAIFPSSFAMGYLLSEQLQLVRLTFQAAACAANPGSD